MMDEPAAGIAPARYRAFISYSHADDRFAGWLHRKLEIWKLPGGARLAPVFIDRAELAAGPDLSAQVREALAGSAALVVVSSPAARASRWVGQEIALFRELHPGAPVLAALAEGEPDAAFPDALLGRDGTELEPLAADFRERRDGKRLALLKIIAGLTGQPLDQLVQRDAQARTRRVMWITAGAVLLSLVLSALLVFAIRQRNEAQRQRAEAEGIVEFMLTDLRDKLKGVGRLDVMDAVNQRAMAHYAHDNVAALPVDQALRRAKLLQAMGSDDIDRAGDDSRNAVIRRRGLGAYAEASRVTATLAAAHPQDTRALFADAQSEFFAGQAAFGTKNSAGQRDLDGARKHFARYKLLAQQLIALEPGNMDWVRELGFAEGVLCAVAQEDKPTALTAPETCHRATAAMRRVRAMRAGELQSGLDLLNRLGWEADAMLHAGRGEAAVALRTEQVGLAEALSKAYPGDARAMKAAMLAELGAAQTLIALKAFERSRPALANAENWARRLNRIDPENGDWKDRLQQIERLKAAAAH